MHLVSTLLVSLGLMALARAEAEPQQFLAPPPMSPALPWPGSSPCELTSACCGMANQNCCVNGRRCYTVWERQCNEEDQPECLVRVDQKCYGAQVRDCRIVSEIRREQFNSSICQPKPMRRCFAFDRKVCRPATKLVPKNVTWVNERLVRESGGRNETHCANVTNYDCENVVEQRNVSAPIRRTRLVPDQQTRCRMVRRPVGTQNYVELPVTRLVYRQVCYDMPVPNCNVAPCRPAGMGCAAPQIVCSQTEFGTQTVCPVTTGPRGEAGPCQEVREPLCEAAGGACGPAQQCCSTQLRRVCRQLPQRVVQRVRQPIAAPMRWEQECRTVDFNRTEIYFEQETRLVNHTERKCTPEIKEECYNFTIPEFSVETEDREDSVRVPVPHCELEVVKDRYCHVFPEGEFECRNTTLTRPIRVNRIKCDLKTKRPFCFNIPRADCRLGANVQCRMVPRQVCQPNCDENNPMCNMCGNFAQNQGFGSCPASSCGNFVQLENPVVGGNMSWAYNGGLVAAQGGQGDFPVVGPQVEGEEEGDENALEDGQAYPGGSGVYPGQGGAAGGSGMYPGGSGSYPGDSGSYPGGSGSYPGGSGMYPGGSGMYPGGSGMYPGGIDMYPGGTGMYPGGSSDGSGEYPGGSGLYAGGTSAPGLFPRGESTELQSENQENMDSNTASLAKSAEEKEQ